MTAILTSAPLEKGKSFRSPSPKRETAAWEQRNKVGSTTEGEGRLTSNNLSAEKVDMLINKLNRMDELMVRLERFAEHTGTVSNRAKGRAVVRA